MKTYLPVEWRPVGGINADRAPVALESYESPLATNWLFEQGVARVRPHLVLDRVWALNAVSYAKSFILDRGATYTQEPYAVFLRGSSIYKWNPYDGTPLEEVTGAGVSLVGIPANNVIVINGQVVVGNHATGMVHWTVGGTTYTVEADAKYRYFTGLNSRVIGAFRIEGGNQDPREIGWSVAGDITDWSGDGSGATTLSDLADSVSGLRTVDNRVVILRSDGYSFGSQTGQSTPAFRFETPIRRGVGFPYPSTIDEYNNSIFGVGRDDVYELTLSKGPAPIGTKIRRLLMPYLAKGIAYHGVIVRGDRGALPGVTQTTSESAFKPRLRYHLVPTLKALSSGAFTFSADDAPHFSYDINEGTWGVHTYNFPNKLSAAYEGITAPAPGGHQSTKLSFLQADIGDQYDWAEDFNSSNEEPAVLHSKVIKIGDGQVSFRVHNMLVSWALEGDYTQLDVRKLPKVEINVRCKSRYKLREQRRELDLALLADGHAGEWYNSWFSMELRGNLFEITVTVPAPVRIALEVITLYVSEGGQLQAGITRDTD